TLCYFFFSSRRRHTRSKRDWSSDVCSSDLLKPISNNRRAWRSQILFHRSETYLRVWDNNKKRVAGVGQFVGNEKVTSTKGWSPRSEERRVGKEGRYRRAEER